MTAYMLIHFDADWDEWKPRFDSDPAGRAQYAKAYSILRGVDSPNDIFVRAEFETVEEAGAFRQRLLDSGALNEVTVKTGPIVVEAVERHTY